MSAPPPDELLHMDTKKLGRIPAVGHRVTGNPRDRTRGAGWEVAHVAIDDHSRVSFVQMHPDEKKGWGCHPTGEPYQALPIACDMDGHADDASFPTARPTVR